MSMTGTCRYCKCRVKLIDGKWMHDGIATLVHVVKRRKESTQ